MINIRSLHSDRIPLLKEYFHNKTHKLHKAVVQADKNCTPLNLAEENVRTENIENTKPEDEWAKNKLHGRLYDNVHNKAINKEFTHKWLAKETKTCQKWMQNISRNRLHRTRYTAIKIIHQRMANTYKIRKDNSLLGTPPH